MCERLSYLHATQNPSGMGSTAALAKTVWEPAAIAACEAAMHATDPRAHGVFFFDMKENEAGVPCVTEINASRFVMITDFHDLIGRHNMAGTYARLGCGEVVNIEDPYDAPGEYYLVRDSTRCRVFSLPTNCLSTLKGSNLALRYYIALQFSGARLSIISTVGGIDERRWNRRRPSILGDIQDLGHSKREAT